jgi:hypothetical protein
MGKVLPSSTDHYASCRKNVHDKRSHHEVSASFKSRHHGSSQVSKLPGWPDEACIRSTTALTAAMRSSAPITSRSYFLAISCHEGARAIMAGI